MADEFTCEAVKKYLLDNGGKVTNEELVKHFKKFLSGPDCHPDARTIFKGHVNSIATIKQENGVKYVVVKMGHAKNSASDSHISSGVVIENGTKTDAMKCKLSNDASANLQGKRQTIVLSNSSPSILGMAPGMNQNSECVVSSNSVSSVWSSDPAPGYVPRPPPRRKHSMKEKENRSAKYEESIRQINEEKELTSPRNDEIREIVSPGSVKEKAHLLNKMASELDLSQKIPSHDHREDKVYDDDTCSVSTLDPRRKEWIIKSSQSDYHELVRLLREEPRLAHVKDYNKYTALHWAAKHGNLDVIKLIAGTHRVDANARTRGGYTPLHLAAMFGREEIMEVLINTYGADASLRDYSGKRPIHYLQLAEHFLKLFPALAFPIQMCGKVIGTKGEKDPTFMRMGSLNSKMKKGSVLSAGGRAITRMKSWGSADNIQDRAVHVMPPPKTFPKKKKSRKHADIIGISENWKMKSGDSDSDSTSGITS